MKKISVLLISLIALFATGCADGGTEVTSSDIYVSRFTDMGCSSTFTDLELGKNSSITGTYPNELVAQLRCNSDVSVRIDFYDYDPRLYPGHYAYFLVNNTPRTYSDTIYVDFTGESSGTYTFTTDQSLYTDDSYYGKYIVTALNLETRRYTVQEYSIYAYENSIWSKEAAVSKFEARTAPKLPVSADNAKSEEVSTDNKTEVK